MALVTLLFVDLPFFAVSGTSLVTAQTITSIIGMSKVLLLVRRNLQGR
jgi:hypothetical protein